MSYNQNSGYGQALLNMVASQVPTFGRVFIVMNSSDTDEENYQRMQEVFPSDPNGRTRFFTDLSDAYDATESNNNDVILLDANSTHSLSSGLATSNNRVHFIGMDGGGRIQQQGAKVQLATAATTAYALKDTGTRNSFRNIKFIQAATAATGLTVAQIGGEGGLIENCSFTFGVANNLDGSETTTYEVVWGGDSYTVKNCLFGTSTLLTTGARAVMAIDQVTSGQEAKDNYFKDCYFTIQSSSSSADFIRVLATTDAKFANTFINPVFFNVLNATNSAVALDDTVRSVSGLVEGNLLFVNPATNATEFCTDVTDQVKVVGAAVSAQAGEAVTPS